MKLDFSGAPIIDAPRKAVWQRLMDPNFIAASAPGVETVEAVDPTHFNVISGLGIGPMRLQFRLDAERSEEHTCELQSQSNLVCRLLLEKKKQPTKRYKL